MGKTSRISLYMYQNVCMYIHLYFCLYQQQSSPKFYLGLWEELHWQIIIEYVSLKRTKVIEHDFFLGVGEGFKSFMQRSNLRKVADSTEEYLNRFRRPFPVLSRIINYWKEINIWDSCTLYYLNYGSLNSTSFTQKISIPAAFVAFAVE